MRLANHDSRATLLVPGGGIDVATASNGRFGPDPQSAYSDWPSFRAWAETQHAATVEIDQDKLGAPVPAPRQVFGIGLNYRQHAAESGKPVPTSPTVFTKFPTCLTGPRAAVTLPSDHVDWEAELVVVIGTRADKVAVARAWEYVAGLTVGQDLSERTVQLEGPVPQFSLGKSFAGFGPIGPAVVTIDELADPDDLQIGCDLDGEPLQKDRTSGMVFSVSELVSRLSHVLTLLPGDLIFTGTPSGVGIARTPARFLTRGSTLTTAIEGLGELRTSLV